MGGPGAATGINTGLDVRIGSNTQVQVFSWDQPVGRPTARYGQFYSSGNTPISGTMGNAVYLRVKPTGGGYRLYGQDRVNVGGFFPTPSLPFVEVSQSLTTGTGTAASPFTVVTTVHPPAPDDGITLTIIDTYVLPQVFFSRRFELTGLPTNGDQASLFWFADTTLAGDDSGYGVATVIAASPTPVFVGNQQYGLLQGVQIVNGMPLWNHYFTGRYLDAWFLINNGSDLNDLVDTTRTDAGFAVQWDIPTTQSTFTTGTGQTYGNLQWVSDSFAPDSIAQNGASRLDLLFENFDPSSAASGVAASYTLDAAIAFAASNGLTHNCPTATVSISGNVLTVTGLSLPVAPPSGASASCTVSANVTSSVIGAHSSNSFSGLSALLQAATLGVLTVVAAPPPPPSSAIPVPSSSAWMLLLLIVALATLAIHRQSRHSS